MRLPNAENAIVSDEKLLRYILNPLHPHGRTHARLFDRLLEINLTNAHRLREELLNAAKTRDVTAVENFAFGAKYTIHFSLSSPRGVYTVLSVWMIESDSEIPRLVTAYIE